MENMTSVQKKQKLIGKYLNIGMPGFVLSEIVNTLINLV